MKTYQYTVRVRLQEDYDIVIWRENEEAAKRDALATVEIVREPQQGDYQPISTSTFVLLTSKAISASKRCQLCSAQEAIHAWHPFGPEPSARDDGAFTALGSHYRGFPTLKICDNCRGELGNGEVIRFTYQKIDFIYLGEQLLKYSDFMQQELERRKHIVSQIEASTNVD